MTKYKISVKRYLSQDNREKHDIVTNVFLPNGKLREYKERSKYDVQLTSISQYAYRVLSNNPQVGELEIIVDFSKMKDGTPY